MELRFFPINIFRETPKVTFFDAGIDTSNSSDVVIHSGEAISPPDDLKDEQYYVHYHQIDHNLVITGERKFVLINPFWDCLLYTSPSPRDSRVSRMPSSA